MKRTFTITMTVETEGPPAGAAPWLPDLLSFQRATDEFKKILITRYSGIKRIGCKVTEVE